MNREYPCFGLAAVLTGTLYCVPNHSKEQHAHGIGEF